jgi:hypothetical protein
MEHFIKIMPRHNQALAVLIAQKVKDAFGGIGIGALHDEGDDMTLAEIVTPLADRGLIENLTKTELGDRGRYFVRITPLGEYCYAKGYMLKAAHIGTIQEMQKYATELSGVHEMTDQPIGFA